jgi:hypothetical protein
MANTLLFNPFIQVVNANGKPYAGAKLYTYTTGTTTPLATYTTSALTTAHANPVIADANGRFPVIFLSTATYRLKLTDSSDVTIAQYDNVSTQNVVDSNGNIKLGSGVSFANNWHEISKDGLTEGGVVLAVFGTGSPEVSVTVFRVDGAGHSSAATAFLVRKNTSTNRSINAAGTINASGADYAEYVRKSETCGTILKGQVCGRDADGRLTDKWSESYTFCVKSTDPAYVGYDAWGAGLESDALEIVRQQYDRIAFCGQCPLNHGGASFGVGWYAIADAGPDDSIVVKFEQAPTLAEHRRAVGQVLKRLEDGRPLIRVGSF